MKRDHEHAQGINDQVNIIRENCVRDLKDVPGALIHDMVRKGGQMHSHKGQNQQTGVGHGLGTEGTAATAFVHCVLDRPGPAVFEEQKDRGRDVNDQGHDEAYFRQYQDFSQGVQVLGIGYEGRGSAINAQVAQQMRGQKKQKEQAADGHQILFAHGGAESSKKPVHLLPPSSVIKVRYRKDPRSIICYQSQTKGGDDLL